jgi:hypothetical protein
MYRVLPVEDLPSYKIFPGPNSPTWLVVTPYIPEKEPKERAYKFRQSASPTREQWYIVVSSHPTKGAADRAYRKLMSQRPHGFREMLEEADVGDKPYHLAMTEKQAQVLVNALDLYSRIGMGQLTEVAHILRMTVVGNPSGTVDALDAVERLTREASSMWMGGSGGYYGITSEKISDVFRVAWDLQQVIRYRLAWDRKPEGGIQVHFDDPMKTSAEELAVIKKV